MNFSVGFRKFFSGFLSIMNNWRASPSFSRREALCKGLVGRLADGAFGLRLRKASLGAYCGGIVGRVVFFLSPVVVFFPERQEKGKICGIFPRWWGLLFGYFYAIII
jgi:hypothetical protein